jgi:myo-inositol-1(or 4)-monophosphatase
MHINLDPDFVVHAVQEAGRALARALAASPRLTERAAIFERFAAVNALTVEALRPALAARWADVAWSSDDELDPAAQRARRGLYWVCDPVDGAVQAFAGLTPYTISLVLMDGDAPQLAVIHAPALGETFHAVAGAGAFRDGQRIRPSEKTDLSVALVTTSQPPFVGREPGAVARAAASLAAVLPEVIAVRNLGATSLQLCWVAEGRLDAYFEHGSDLDNWLAGALVAREAGASVTSARGDAFTPDARSILVAAPGLAGPLARLLADVL